MKINIEEFVKGLVKEVTDIFIENKNLKEENESLKEEIVRLKCDIKQINYNPVHEFINKHGGTVLFDGLIYKAGLYIRGRKYVYQSDNAKIAVERCLNEARKENNL